MEACMRSAHINAHGCSYRNTMISQYTVNTADQLSHTETEILFWGLFAIGCTWDFHFDNIRCSQWSNYHYNDVIISAMTSQITSLTIVYSTVYSGADQRKHQPSGSLAFVRGIHRWPASNAENVSIWWRHHVVKTTTLLLISPTAMCYLQIIKSYTCQFHRKFKWLTLNPCCTRSSRNLNNTNQSVMCLSWIYKGHKFSHHITCRCSST